MSSSARSCVVCSHCNKSFAVRRSLYKHITKFHINECTSSNNEKRNVATTLFTCPLCDSSFSKESHLDLHLFDNHNIEVGKEGSVENESDKETSTITCVTCSDCNESFSYRHNLYNHIREMHFSSDTSSINERKFALKPRIICPLCDAAFSRESFLSHHFLDDHNIELHKEQKSFESEEDFISWKKNIENSKSCRYATRTSKKLKNGDRRLYMSCHRSGEVRTQAIERKRRMHQTSVKISSTCPSNMVVTMKTNGTVDVHICTTHVGHSENLSRCKLSKDEQTLISNKLAAGIPYENILSDQMGDDLVNFDESAIQISDSDLNILKQNYQLHSERQHRSDLISVQLWVSKILTLPSKENPIIYYKAENEADPNNILLQEDVVLILATHFQRECLVKFGQDKICIDSIHSGNPNELVLTTVLVVNEFQNGLPTVFCLSNRKGISVWRLLCRSIKDIVGEIPAKMFISDDDPSYYNAWKDVMGPVQHSYFCSWHVDRIWRKQLQSAIKGKNEKKIAVYKTLKILQHETNEKSFCEMQKNMLKHLFDDPDTREFGTYFKTYYAERLSLWAYCYSRGLSIDTNKNLENTRKYIEYFYFNGWINRRLDKCIDALMKYSRYKILECLKIICENELSQRQDDVLNSHEKSKRFQFSDVIRTKEGKNVWFVQSRTKKSFHYGVYKLNDTCSVTNCFYKCSVCNACLHMYSCECVDYVIRGNTCEHLHFVQRLISEPEEQMGIAENLIDYVYDAVPLKEKQSSQNVNPAELTCDVLPLREIQLSQNVVYMISEENSRAETLVNDVETKMKTSVAMFSDIKDMLHDDDEATLLELNAKLDGILITLHEMHQARAKKCDNDEISEIQRSVSTKRKKSDSSNSFIFSNYGNG